jgi:hypothetical protein
MKMDIEDVNPKDNIDTIFLDDNSFFYPLKKELYYNDKLIINSYTIFKFYFIDFEKDNNKYDVISYENGLKQVISNDVEYICITNGPNMKFEYYSYDFALKNTNKDISSGIFQVYGYKGLLNKINVLLNINSPKTYYYEFLYYNLDEVLGEISKKIIVDNEVYEAKMYDSFGSHNRKRISIMNIPYQINEIPEEELESNSIQICELKQNSFKKVVGIYNILPLNVYYNSNNFFDNYYDTFGDIYDKIIKEKKEEEEEKEKKEEKVKKEKKEKKEKDIEEFLDKKDKLFSSILIKTHFKDACIYDDKMTLSQYKARIGLIICFYWNILKKKKMENSKFFKLIKDLFEKYTEKNLNFYEIIRLLIFALNEFVINNSSSNLELCFVSDLDEDSPYSLAYKFNKEQIESLDEFSALFEAYIQLDSFKAYNYLHSRVTYSFSMELNFMIKYHLLSTYEDFFYIKRIEGIETAYLDVFTRITVINEATTFKNQKKHIYNINDLEAKNYAMPISINFLHEKSGHYKYFLKNIHEISPMIYFRGLRAEVEVTFQSGIINGESGKMIENFICHKKEIITALSKKLIFGHLLSKEYFTGRDFKKLIAAVKDELKNQKKDENEPKFDFSWLNYDVKNINDFVEFNDSSPFIQFGDLVYDVDILRKNLLISDEERRKEYEENRRRNKEKILAMKKRLMDLNQRNNDIDN